MEGEGDLPLKPRLGINDSPIRGRGTGVGGPRDGLRDLGRLVFRLFTHSSLTFFR